MSEIRNYDISEVTNRDFALKKDEFKKRFNEIINKPLTVDNIDSFADDALNELIVLIGEIKEEYENRHLIEEGQQIDQNTLESLACVEYGLPETSPILDLITKKVSQLEQIDDFINNNIIQRNEVIVPPDQISPEFGNGEGREKKDPSIIPRLKTLLYILEADFSLDLKELTLTQGQNTKEMVRKLSYVTVEAPEINRVVQVCDEEGNASYIFDLAEMEKHGISVEDLNQTTKEEKNELIKQYSALGIRVIQSPNWRHVVSEYLSEKIPEREIKDKGYFFKPDLGSEKVIGDIPEVSKSEVDPWRGFWTDEEGKHWGALIALGKKLNVSANLVRSRVQDLNLPLRKLKGSGGNETDGFCFEDLQEKMKDYLALPQVEKTGTWTGFWTDEEGKHWGAVMTLSKKFNVSYKLVKTRVQDIKLLPRKLKDYSGNEVEGFCLEDLQDKMQDFLALSQVEKTGTWAGFWTDKEGKHWGAANELSERLKVSVTLITARVKNLNLTPRRLKGVSGRQIDGFCFEDLQEKIKDYLGLPQVEKTGTWAGFWTDKEGKHWGAVKTLGKRFNISADIVKTRVQDLNLPSHKLKDVGNEIEGFCLEDLQEKMKDFLALPQVEKTGTWAGFWTDKEGKHWGAAATLGKKLNASFNLIKARVQDLSLPSRKLKDAGGHEVDGFCLEDLQEKMKDYLGLPQVEKTGTWAGFWTDKEGKHWGAVGELSKRSNVSETLIRARVADLTLPSRKLKGISGKEIEGICLEGLQEIVRKP